MQLRTMLFQAVTFVTAGTGLGSGPAHVAPRTIAHGRVSPIIFFDHLLGDLFRYDPAQVWRSGRISARRPHLFAILQRSVERDCHSQMYQVHACHGICAFLPECHTTARLRASYLMTQQQQSKCRHCLDVLLDREVSWFSCPMRFRSWQQADIFP